MMRIGMLVLAAGVLAGCLVDSAQPGRDGTSSESAPEAKMSGEPGGTAKKRVIILCTGNTARSQMAEGFWRSYAGDRWEVVSAGTSPKGYVNPLAIAAMKEVGIDISRQTSKSPDRFLNQQFDLVVTVCSNAEQSCPSFRNTRTHEHWPFDDPAHVTGSKAEKLKVFRRVRDEISTKVKAYLATAERPSR